MLEEFDRPGSRRQERAYLIVLAVHNENGDVDHLEIVVKLGFGEDLDALVVGCDASHHSLTPPIRSSAQCEWSCGGQGSQRVRRHQRRSIHVMPKECLR